MIGAVCFRATGDTTMMIFNWSEPPADLLARGVELGILDLETVLSLIEQLGDELHQMRRRVEWLAAILAAGEPTTEERERLEERAVRLAAELLEHEQRLGLEALAGLLPHLSVERQETLKARVRPMLESHRQLGDRRILRVLAPDAFPDWLHSIVAMQGGRWIGLRLRDFLDRLSILPDLEGAERHRFLEAALASVGSVHDPYVSLDAEEGIGGIQKYSSKQVADAQSAAQNAAFRILGPLLPTDLRDHALTLGFEPRSSLRWTPAELIRARWGSFRWVRHQLDEVSRLAWIVGDLNIAERTALAGKLAARLAELAPLAAHGVAAAREAMRPLVDIALPPLASALSPVQTETLLGYYGLVAASRPVRATPARTLPLAWLPPPLLRPALAFGLVDVAWALRHAASVRNRPPPAINSWVDYPSPTLRVDMQIAILGGASLDDGKRAEVEAQALQDAQQDSQTGPYSRAMVLAHLTGERRATFLNELSADLDPRPWPGMSAATRETWIGSLWWNRFDQLRLLGPSLPEDLHEAVLDRHLVQHPLLSSAEWPEGVFRARLALIPNLDGTPLRKCLEAALDAAIRVSPGTSGGEDRARWREAALASLAPYLPDDLRIEARQAARRDGYAAPPHLDWGLKELSEAMRDNFVSPRCPEPWSNPHWLAPYSLQWSRWQDTLPSWRRIATLLIGMEPMERARVLDDLCDRFAALAAAYALDLSVHSAYWPLVTVGLRAAEPFLSQEQVAALLELYTLNSISPGSTKR